MNGSYDDSYDVVVVGGGVSGTAAAAACAQAGKRALLLSSSLDVTGLPSYGPVVGAAVGVVRRELAALPASIRGSWGPELLCDERSGLVVMDPRNVSLRLKWALENMPGLDLRQATVVAVEWKFGRGRVGGGIEVFGALKEVFRARACVLAPGLGLRGSIRMGEQELSGGRYGEVPADELCDQLEVAGVALTQRSLLVGAVLWTPTRLLGLAKGRLSRAEDDAGSVALGVDEIGESDLEADLAGDPWVGEVKKALGGDVEPRALAGLVGDCLREKSEEGGASRLAGGAGSVGEDGADGACGRRLSGGRGPVPDLALIPPPGPSRRVAFLNRKGQGLVPTGQALDEWYLAGGLEIDRLTRIGFAVSRLPYVVNSCGIAAESDRPAMGERVWVTGRCRGANTYWESVKDGASVGRQVVALLQETTLR